MLNLRCIVQPYFSYQSKIKGKVANSHTESTGVMNPEEVDRLIMQHERLTTWMLQKMPAYSDILLEVDVSHQIVNMTSDIA